MPNIFDGFNRARDKDIINQIVLLRSITFTNLMKIQGQKTLKASLGEVPVRIPREHQAMFESQIGMGNLMKKI